MTTPVMVPTNYVVVRIFGTCDYDRWEAPVLIFANLDDAEKACEILNVRRDEKNLHPDHFAYVVCPVYTPYMDGSLTEEAIALMHKGLVQEHEHPYDVG